MGSIGKMSDQGKINFLSKEVKEAQTPPAPKVEAKPELKGSTKLDNSKAMDYRSANTILNAGGGGQITDTGGPTKYIGSQTNNSIWDSDVINKLSSQKDNGEKLRETNAEIQKVRNSFRQEGLDELAKNLSEVDTRTNASVKESSVSDSKNYHSPKNNLSIFDTDRFDKMAEKTDGEKMADEARKPKEKDDGWRKMSTPMSSSKIANAFFDKLANQGKKE